MKDLIIKNPTYELPSIDYDLQPLKDELEIIKDKYANWVVQESDLENAKKVKASLNSAKTKLDRQRIDLIKEITKPLSEFENELKGIAKEIKEISDSIDNQVQDYEDERKNQKEIEIKGIR